MQDRMRQSERELRKDLLSTVQACHPGLPYDEAVRRVDDFLHFAEPLEDPGLVWRMRERAARTPEHPGH